MYSAFVAFFFFVFVFSTYGPENCLPLTRICEVNIKEVFLPGESPGRGSLVGCYLWGHTESDTTEVT